MRSLHVAAAVLIAVLAFPTESQAHRKLFGWIYEPMGFIPGSSELEIYNSVYAGQIDSAAGERYFATEHRLEAEYNPLEFLQTGMYVVFRKKHASSFELRGLKLKTIINPMRVGEKPFGLGLELETTFYSNEFELELRLNFGARIKKFVVATNLVIEPKFYYFEREVGLELKPLLGLGFQFHPKFFLGLELLPEIEMEWVEGEKEDAKFSIFLGPTVNWAPTEAFWFSLNWGIQLSREAMSESSIHQARLTLGIPLGGHGGGESH